MSYCNITDVNECISQQPFSANSVPSQSTVERFIADVSAEMDAVLRNMGYNVPIVQSGTLADFQQAQTLLRNANKYGAAGLAQDSRMSAVLRDDMVAGGKNVWTLRYESWKKALLDNKNPYELPGCARTTFAIVKPQGQIESSTSSDYLNNPPFTIGMKM